MTARERFARRVARLVDAAHRDGLRLVADYNGAIRVCWAEEMESDDIRDAGIAVQLDNGCNGPGMSSDVNSGFASRSGGTGG